MKMPLAALAALKGATIRDVYYHGGSPGGHNNDLVRLTLTSGAVVSIDTYAMSGIVVSVKEPERVSTALVRFREGDVIRKGERVYTNVGRTPRGRSIWRREGVVTDMKVWWSGPSDLPRGYEVVSLVPR